jgi:AMP-polyphosphate phosphotransferase
MGIDLHDYESGAAFAGDFAEDSKALQARLTQAQIALTAHGRSAIIVVDGWEQTSSGDAIAALCSCWDARRAKAWDQLGGADGRHFLQPYWEKLPRAGEIALFDGGWHADVLHGRVSGAISDMHWKRVYDEINAFEAQQRDAGIVLIKLLLHINGDELELRVDALRDDPWQFARVTPRNVAMCDHRADYLEPLTEQINWTDTRWAPWTLIDANNREAARFGVMAAVADALERALPKDPPARDDAPFMLQDS